MALYINGGFPSGVPLIRAQEEEQLAHPYLVTEIKGGSGGFPWLHDELFHLPTKGKQ